MITCALSAEINRPELHPEHRIHNRLAYRPDRKSVRLQAVREELGTNALDKNFRREVFNPVLSDPFSRLRVLENCGANASNPFTSIPYIGDASRRIDVHPVGNDETNANGMKSCGNQL